MIKATNLQKNYGEQTVLTDVSFEVSKQEIFALLGPSGAGKSTIINLITKQLVPDGGEISVDVTPSQIGLMLDIGGLYQHLNCTENLLLYSRIYGLPNQRVLDVLEMVGLQDSAKKAVSELSRGMSQRLALARAILYSPKLLVLDEPTSALDPGTTRNICKLLQKLRDDGTTIFLTTHNMDEALNLCDRVALLHKGEIVVQDTPTNLCEKHNAMRTVPDLEAVFLQLTGVEL